MRQVLVTIALLMFGVVPLSSMGFDQIQNRWKPSQHLHIEYGPIEAGTIQPGWHSAQWTLQPIPNTGFVRIQNRWKSDRYLHIERGGLEAGPIRPGWWSAMWIVEPVQGTRYVRLKNRWKPDQYIHIEYGRVHAGPIQHGWHSAMWRIQPAGRMSAGFCNNQTNCISLRYTDACDYQCTERVGRILSRELGINVRPSTTSPLGPPGCIGYRSDIGGTREMALRVQRILGPDYYLGNCTSDGFEINVRAFGHPARFCNNQTNCISLRYTDTCDYQCTERVGRILSRELGINVRPSTISPLGPPGCIGFRSDIGGTREMAMRVQRILGPDYYLGDCTSDGFEINVRAR